MNIRPIEIKRAPGVGIEINWSDGSSASISNETLRRNCPCATCREQRGDDTHAKPLTGKKKAFAIVESSLSDEISLVQIWAVGQYAIGFSWQDGHDTGIYSYKLLYDLGRKSAAPLPDGAGS